MIYRALDSNGDYTFGQNTNNFLRASEAVAQAIKTKLLLLSAEWWEDQADGLPLFQKILGRTSTRTADMLIRSRIMETPNVIGIESFNSSIVQRNYSMQAKINTMFGTVEVSL